MGIGIGTLKSKVASWVITRGLSDVLKQTEIDKQNRKRIINAVKDVLKGKKIIKNEPVLLGGIITVVVALAGSYGLELTTEELGITISTIIAVVTFLQRKFVSPIHKGE